MATKTIMPVETEQQPESLGANLDLGNNSQMGAPLGSVFGEQSNMDMANSGMATGSVAGDFGVGASPSGAAPSEFGGASAFGNTSAVSQMFGEASSQSRRNKMMMYGGIAGGGVLLLMLILYFTGAFSSSDEQATSTQASATAAPIAQASPMVATEDEALLEEEEGASDEAGAPATAESSYEYNEIMGGPIVKVADGTIIEVSRKENFSTLYVFGPAKKGEFRIPNPPPGNIYWRQQGTTEVHAISVTPPKKLGIGFSAPASVTGGSSLSWKISGGAVAAFYKLEVASDPGFSSVVATMSTSQTSVALNGVPAGKYQMRVTGFNQNAGQWEHSSPVSVEVK